MLVKACAVVGFWVFCAVVFAVAYALVWALGGPTLDESDGDL